MRRIKAWGGDEGMCNAALKHIAKANGRETIKEAHPGELWDHFV